MHSVYSVDAAPLGTRSFFLVSSDNASVQRETKHCLVAHLLCAEAMQKDQHEVYYVLSPAPNKREEELHSLSTQVTHGPLQVS